MNEPTKVKRKLPAVIRWILWVLLFQFVLINIMAALYANKLTRFYEGVPLNNSHSSGNIFSKTWKLFTGPKQGRSVITEQPAFPFQAVSLKTSSGLNIEAWYSATDSVAKGTVLFFHGITSQKSILLDEAGEFRYWGYNVMLVDFRGHGNSEGNTSTIGMTESEEVKLAYDFVSQRGEKNIYLYGVSLGAVAAAKAITEYDLHPKAVVLDMPFASLQSYLKNKARNLGFPAQPFAFLTTFWIGIERGYNGFNHQASHYVKKMDCPVLMEWGANDAFILREEAERVYSSIGSAQKRMVIYDASAHESFLRKEPLKWKIEMQKFFQQ
jgi:uncharacterized protein